MGDGGSHFIGFLLSTSTIIAFSNPLYLDFTKGSTINEFSNIFYLTPYIIPILLPVFDMLRVVFNRIINKYPIIYGDRRHLHYLIIDSGKSERKTTLIICTGYLLISSISLLFISKVIAAIYLIGIIPIFLIKIKKN